MFTHTQVFTNPEEHKEMHQFLINQTLREKDLNKDGSIDFNEYIGERGKLMARWSQGFRAYFYISECKYEIMSPDVTWN